MSAEQPLPSKDEVLYCNSKTTSEEIELFWLRVLSIYQADEKEQKIYSLINVQDLLYDQAVKAQASFEKLMANYSTNNKFLLCIICSAEREDKSVFVTAFNRYRKNFNLPNDINKNLNIYLRKQFKQKKEPFFEDKYGKELLSVQVITSDRAGVGKSLYVQRQIENSKSKTNRILKEKCVSIKKQTLPFESVFEIFKNFEKEQCRNKFAKIYHIDIAYEVWYEVDYFLFNLLCLGVIVNSNGKIFRRSPTDLYLIEIMSPKFKPKDSQDDDQMKPLHSILKILPSLKCISPVQVFDFMSKNAQLPEDLCPILFDQTILNSELIQRPCQYLYALDHNQNINVMSYNPNDSMDAKTCLELMLKHLECETASWFEIIHFAKFLNTQLMDCERSYYCDPSLTGEDLPEFKAFVVKFMVQMSHDFALPSLEISDRSALQLVDSNQAEFQLNQLKMRRKWENDPHPYLFFNPDGQTFTFFGFYVDRRTGQIIDFQTKSPLFENRLSLSVDLIHGLYAQNKSILYENIAELPKEAKIQKLLSVMGINSDRVVDPDPSYELTMDNLLKILAIYMRLRADIPVIIMGETGCGKTRLCKYMCDLLKYFHQNVENMYLVKVHGGTVAEEIIRHVQKAEDLARKNWALGSGIFTILFFDEANSTEAIGTIKEIMCDSRVNGLPLDKNHGLKIIAACNPYKKHSDEIIQNFDKSGLGFYVDINETQEKLGDLPMRHLVYRVQPLPASMLPMIWDFGQLNDQVEYLYINQIVRKKLERLFSQNEMNLIVKVLCASQKFMREQNNECSFVSLRDVQRVLKIIQWFMTKAENIFRHLKPRVDRNSPELLRAESILTLNQIDETENDEDLLDTETPIENSERHELLLSSIILALNACYHVGLQSEESRKKYRIKISSCFDYHAIDQEYFLNEIDNCYEKFLSEIKLPDAIARNQALKENIFMILICIELKIPLFIIGKPGSSKSLAKTLISNKMQGSDRNSSPLLSTFKEAHLITFQCSPMSTSEMILNTFRYCARYQFERRNDLDRYTSVIVLDEIGLAEASASMPLKTLHPLLEDGVHFEEKEEQELCKKIPNGNLYEQNWNQIGFIGISNWVLDPAKMNRGIFVNRNNPSTSELKDTVVGICKNDKKVLEKLTQQRLIESLSSAYLNLCEKARNKIREFFGLRDFYALIKMIYWHTKESESNEIDWLFLERAIKRNFGGLVDLDPSGTFIKQFQDDKINLKITKNNLNVIDLVKEALLKRTTEDENRYLLLLSQNDNALDLINNFVLNELDNGTKHSKIKIIFGSSFPNDQKYSQICRKIHQIKLSMELGKTVILLNLENLYESLYDALNQFYYKFGDDTKFVDLGLGTARVKCLVHEEFRLIVVADKKSVYNPKKYPIPLVNRLEKHLLSIDSILNEKLRYIVNNIQQWTKEFTSISEKYGFGMRKTNSLNKLKPSDIFIGFTDETIASLVYKISREKFENILLDEESDEDWVQSSERVQEMVKIVLIQSSTSDGVIRLLPEKKFNNQRLDLDFVIDNYYKFQTHENFDSFFQKYLLQPLPRENFIQITTHSKLLSPKSITIANAKFRIESLLSFDSQQQFVQVLKEFFTANLKKARSDQDPNVLIVQCDCGHIYTDLVNCARFAIIDEYTKYVSDLTKDQLVQVPNDFFVVFIIQVPKIAGGCFNGFQTSKWFCYHIDDLQNNVCVDNILDYENKTLSQVFDESLPDIDEKSFKILINILHSVIFNACSRVTDNYSGKRPHKSEETKSRAIQRIEKLLSIFKDQNLHSKFFPILIKHLARLQTERETELSTPQVSRSWILNEVSKISNVIKYATLKNSCQNYIENRVAHLFSGIIALIDCNQNLDLLLQPEKEWSRDFWLQIFDDNEILNLKYVTNYNKANHREKNEFICFNHYSELKLKLPFSWIIKDYFDKLTQLKIKEIETSDGDAQIGDNEINVDHFKQQLQNAFEQSILKKKLDTFFDSVSQNEKIEFIMAYVNDFILLSSSEPFISVDHFRLVKNRLMQYCKKNYCRLQNDLNFLIGLHCSYEKLNLEIKLFSKFAKIDPKCIDLIAKSDNQDSNISFLAARILCNNFINISNEMKVDQWFEWFEKVQKTTALIEKMMDLSTEIKSEKFEEFDSLWQRTTLLKLYIENICIKEIDLYQRCFQFWKFFDTIVDFKKKETFEKFVKILDPIFKFGKNLTKKFSIKCSGCEYQESDALFTTPDCPRCLVCIDCINKTQLNKRCQNCTKEQIFDERISFKKVSGNDEYKQKISFLKINFNTFYMDVVKNLCFCRPNEKLPEDQCLLPKSNGENVSTTLDFNHTPSIKSSLFQLLLNFNENVMRKHLLEIFTKSENYLRENYNKKDLISLKLMYLNAIEDNLYSRSSLVKNEQNFDHDIQLAIRTLKDLLNQSYEIEDEVSRLKFVAKIRFCLTTCSKLVTNIDQSCEHHMQLIRLVKILINRNKSWFRLFLIKNIFRIHGRAETMKIANQEILRDFVPPDLVTDRNNRPKIYAIFGNKYKEIQKLIEDCLITEDYNKIKNRQENFDVLLNNNNLPIAKNQNSDLNIQFLLMHVFASSLKNQKGTILEPFIKLINNPEKYAQCYLPSIPHDDDFEAYQTFLNNGKENVAWFRCPNGHLYTIGECTQPMQDSICPTCKAQIGGTQHRLIPGNTKVENITEKKSQGYSLDPNDDKQSIRNMGQLNTILIRLLLDCCMFLTAFKNPAQTKRLVHSPNIDAQNLQDFFLNQIKQNIKKLSQCLQHSPEESLLLFHHFIHKIGTVAHPINGFDSKLTKKTDRNNFEQILCAFIKDRVFENKSVDNAIEELNTILKENASDSDRLFRIAYDLIDSPQDKSYLNNKQFWTFRRQITLDVMKQNFSVLPNQQKSKDFRFLSEFLERMDTLKAIKYLPSLLKMVDTFFKIFNRQIDRQTSLEIKLGDVLNDNPMFKMDQILKNQIKNGAINFLKAWKMVSAQIISKFDKKNFEKLIEILLNTDIDNFGDIPIAFFLPNSKNEGFLIYSLLFFLINVQNEFIQFYVGNILNKSVIENTVTIGLENVTKSDLISFSPEKDILRLVYIHSNYSLEESKNINLEFDFNKIQNSIERKLIVDKPLIDTRGILLIEFSDNTRNDLKRFENLERRVKQQELSFVIKEKICFFYKKPDQLNDIIRKLNIVIDFINSTGCPEDIKIIDYAIDTLKMTNIDGSNINKQISELDVSYLKSLWNLLNLRRAILLTEHRQEPFDALNDAFRHPIQKEQDNQENGIDDNDGNKNEELAKTIISNKYQKPENMLIILEFLYKYIIYRLIPNSESFEKSKNDETELLNGEIPIEHVFNELANDTDFSQDQVDFQIIDLNNIKLKNVNHLWKILVIIYLKNSNL
ncbi:E3 ubiquitin-ligase RNF213-like [Brachionus plicatilis]|uniref:E3 ubiquitin-ligase RNF213-like n=1 Tax=Brachionus plicatilis TaxID=10195 RepID=A0A3M7S5P9_BRAPC|nr:E3 ubiquitin-ligase RNF213-like [Brachionus plicatilis]